MQFFCIRSICIYRWTYWFSYYFVLFISGGGVPGCLAICLIIQWCCCCCFSVPTDIIPFFSASVTTAFSDLADFSQNAWRISVFFMNNRAIIRHFKLLDSLLKPNRCIFHVCFGRPPPPLQLFKIYSNNHKNYSQIIWFCSLFLTYCEDE